jgi:hypothetical protein
VQLVDPDGNDYTATSPVEYVNLVYGASYVEKSGSSRSSAKKDEAK